ncbi:hypothetical protein JNJ66_04660 [Candidatus Saccharibacteria bacterium]|nr:hypothetical protein [Candidatus Saccharibacteria bacterium]
MSLHSAHDYPIPAGVPGEHGNWMSPFSPGSRTIMKELVRRGRPAPFLLCTGDTSHRLRGRHRRGCQPSRVPLCRRRWWRAMSLH